MIAVPRIDILCTAHAQLNNTYEETEISRNANQSCKKN